MDVAKATKAYEEIKGTNGGTDGRNSGKNGGYGAATERPRKHGPVEADERCDRR